MRGRTPISTLALCLALVSAAGGPAAARAKKAQVDLRKWIDGPVRYIVQPEERKVFQNLKADEDRAFFIDRFWARRDPSPETLANEYRQMFWERVKEANSLFIDSPRGGWTTDRGKIYILYGPPTKIEDYFDLNTRSDVNSGHGLIRWFYEGRPGGITGTNPVIIVPFERLSSGEYRLSYDPKLSSVFFDEHLLQDDYAHDAFIRTFGGPRATELGVMLDLGRLQEVPPQAQVLLERVETSESYQTHPLQVVLSRYLHPDRHGVLAVVTADVSQVPVGAIPSVIARFMPHDATREPRVLGEDSFRLAEGSAGRVAQGRLVLEPGDYDVTVFVANPATASTGMHRMTIAATGRSPRMHLSDVILADELAPLEFAALASWDEPYHLGPYRVVPRLSDRFRQGERVKLLYEIYGASPPFRIAYQVEGRENDGSWIALGRPSEGEQDRPTQGWELPTSTEWPPGAYRIRIEIRDAEERLVTAQLPFTLDAAEGSP